jgi:hypothetical protein
MKFFRKIQKFFRKKSIRKIIYPEYANYKGAGCMFTDGKYILAGYQKKGRSSYISGIGGKIEDNESYIKTAIREMIEELFEVKNVPQKLIQKIEDTIKPYHIFRNRYYVNVVYSFENLLTILKIIRKGGIETSIYKYFPTTINELIFNRMDSTDAELTHICVLPLVKHDTDYDLIDLSFVTDMQILFDTNL